MARSRTKVSEERVSEWGQNLLSEHCYNSTRLRGVTSPESSHSHFRNRFCIFSNVSMLWRRNRLRENATLQYMMYLQNVYMLFPTTVPMWSAWIRIQGKPPLTATSQLRECVYMYNLRTYAVCTSDIESMSVCWRGCNDSPNWWLVLSSRWTHSEPNRVHTLTHSFLKIRFKCYLFVCFCVSKGPVRFSDAISGWIIVSSMRAAHPVQLTVFVKLGCLHPVACIRSMLCYAKLCTAGGYGAAAGNSLENCFGEYLAVTLSRCVGCQECQQIFCPFRILF
jgi:hypothetical protein